MSLFERFSWQIQEEQIAYPETFPKLAERWKFEIEQRYVTQLTEDERRKLLEMLNIPLPS